MPRVRFEDVEAHASTLREARFRKAARPPEGYTGNTFITEWLTLNCKGNWGSQADNRSVHVRFADPDDHVRALAALPLMQFRRP